MTLHAPNKYFASSDLHPGMSSDIKETTDVNLETLTRQVGNKTKYINRFRSRDNWVQISWRCLWKCRFKKKYILAPWLNLVTFCNCKECTSRQEKWINGTPHPLQSSVANISNTGATNDVPSNRSSCDKPYIGFRVPKFTLVSCGSVHPVPLVFTPQWWRQS